MPQTCASSSSSEPKRATPCNACRRRKSACHREPGQIDPCARCAARGTPCEVEEEDADAVREANQQAAMRAQFQRLERVLECLENTTSQSQPSASRPDIDLNDIVGSLQDMLITADGIDESIEPNIEPMRDCDLLLEAQRIVSEGKPADMEQNGFVLNAAMDSGLTMSQLIDRLPAWPETRHLLLDVFPRVWVFPRFVTYYSPDFPARVEALYKAGFDPPPPPAALAELFAVLCLTQSYMASKHGRDPDLYRRVQAEADRFGCCAYRALVLADYIERPSLQILRALHTLVIAFVAIAKDTTRFRRALALLPVAVSMLYRLKLHLDDAHLLAKETRMQTYERRLLVHAIVYDDSFFTLIWTKHAFVDLDTFACPAAEWLRDEDLPVILRDSPYRSGPVILQTLAWRLKTATIRRNVFKKLSAAKLVSHADVVGLHQSINAFEGDFLRWLANLPADTTDSDEVAIARQLVMPSVWQLRVQLHRPFVAYWKPVAGLAWDDVAWHRDSLLDATQALITQRTQWEHETGTWLGLSYVFLDMLIACCLIFIFDPDHPRAAKTTVMLKAYAQTGSTASSPSFVRRATRLMLYILDQPKLRQTSRVEEPTKGKGSKRPRYGRTEVAGPHVSGLVAPASPTPDHLFTFSVFEPVPVPSMDDTDILPRKRSLFLSPGSPGITEVRDTLDLLEQLESTTPSDGSFEALGFGSDLL